MLLCYTRESERRARDTHAFRDAELLSVAIDNGLSGHEPWQNAIVQYERQPSETAGLSFKLNFQFATLEPPTAGMLTLLGALEEINQILIG